jgi:hypothetical protein
LRAITTAREGEATRSLRVQSKTRAGLLLGLSKQLLLIAPRLADTYFELNALSD